MIKLNELETIKKFSQSQLDLYPDGGIYTVSIIMKV